MSTCEHCGDLADITEAGLLLCRRCKETTGGTRNKERGAREQQARKENEKHRPLVPLVPLSTGEDSEPPEIEQLLAMYRKGEIEPDRVALKPLPDGMPPLFRPVAEFIRLVYGLRLAAGDDRALPLAARWMERKVGIPRSTAHRALKALEAADWLERRGSLPGQDGRRGTALYMPVGTDDGGVAS